MEKWKEYTTAEKRVKALAEETASKAVGFLRFLSNLLLAYVAVSPTGDLSASGGSYGGETATETKPQQDWIYDTKPSLDLTQYALPPGFRWIPLDEIEVEYVPESAFHKVNSNTMHEGLARLGEVLECLQERLTEPFTDNSVYFMRLDRRAGRTYEAGLQRVYEAFFGHDRIRLSRIKGSTRWTIDNGRHRIQVARALGWQAIPAEPVEVEWEKND